MGFEPTRAEHNGLAVHRLNHSATSSIYCSDIIHFGHSRVFANFYTTKRGGCFCLFVCLSGYANRHALMYDPHLSGDDCYYL